jgi:NTE family protein
MLENFPVTVFDRTDGNPPRWPTFGIKLSTRPTVQTDKPIRSLIGEALGIKNTALGEWNRYPLEDEGVTNRTIYVDTMGVKATAFDLAPTMRNSLFVNGGAAAQDFLEKWNSIPRGAPITLNGPAAGSVPQQGNRASAGSPNRRRDDGD